MMPQLRDIIKLVIVIAPLIIISISFILIYVNLQKYGFESCKCVNDTTICTLENKIYIYSECKSYGLLLDTHTKKASYSIMYDIRYYIMIFILTIVSTYNILFIVPIIKFVYVRWSDTYDQYIRLENEQELHSTTV